MSVMRSTFKVLFYIKKNAIKSNGKAPIMARITLDGKISQFSLKCDVLPSDWNPKTGRVNGRAAQAVQLNGMLDNFRAIILQHYRNISERESIVTAEKVRNAFLGLQFHHETLLEIFKNHINLLSEKYNKKLISKDLLRKFERIRDRLQIFMREKYHLSDINIKDINYSFISDFEVFIKAEYGCSHNTVMKNMQQFRTIIIIAKKNGWLYADPFDNYKFGFKKTERNYLEGEELERLAKKEFSVKRLEQVRDIFLFSCYSGLAYIDVKSLTMDNIQQSFDKNLWIIGKRVKTDTTYRVPLLDIPKMLIDKYKDKSPNGFIFPVLSNNKMNAYLKEIADICGISKLLTFHVARHSFATLTLTKGVSIESVSKMLGHTNIRTTQIYARITDPKISSEMAAFAQKIEEEKVTPKSKFDILFESLSLKEKMTLFNLPATLSDDPERINRLLKMWNSLSEEEKSCLWVSTFENRFSSKSENVKNA
jgi:site-specific recombinase XerD